MSAIKNYATLSRWEFLPATGVAILIGVFLGMDTWDYLLEPMNIMVILEGLVIFFFLFNTGFMVNCWADWEVDEEYKSRLSETVRTVGRDRVAWMVVGHIAVSIILAIHLTLVTSRVILLVLVLIGTFLGVAYSVEPFRFKSKGVLHSVMAFPVFSAPGMFSFFLVSDVRLTDTYFLVFLLLVIGITTAHYALVLLSQSEDFPEDRAMGITTPAVAWGLDRTVHRAFKMNLWGTTASVLSFLLFFVLAEPQRPLLYGLLPVLAMAAYSTTYEVHRLAGAVRDAGPVRSKMRRIRKAMRAYPRFHGVPLGAIMLCSMALMIGRSLGSV